MSIIAAILVFSVLVLFHEFGHFLMARRGGIAVVEFSLGMGPRLFSVIRGGTRYSIKLFPFGGSCMMLGEDEPDLEEEDQKTSAKEETAPCGVPFYKASAPVRFSVVAGGPVFNFILAFFCALIVVASSGIDRPVIYRVSEGFPAQEAGLSAGDTIKSINGEQIHLYRELLLYLNFHPEEDYRVVYDRDGEAREALIVPKYSEEYGRYLMGVSGGQYSPAGSPAEVLRGSVYEMEYCFRLTIGSLGMLIRRQITRDDVAGPVRMVSLIGETVDESRQYGLRVVLINLLAMSILLSANLDVMNILPLPALDGGRLVFIVLEVILGHPVNREFEGRVHFAGFMMLMALMLFVFYNDIRTLLIGG